jgi:hypothetical protein
MRSAAAVKRSKRASSELHATTKFIVDGLLMPEDILPASLLAVQPFARVLISFASFSISSAFFTIASESVLLESVFSTSSFKSEAS